MTRRFSITVRGRVQGVFFRWSAKEQAERLGLSGFISNEPDGTVRIEVQGENGALAGFMDWCKTGPRMADVDKLESDSIEPVAEKGFSVR
ncbi:MAG: acylphosphatase [Patescibacteria group bacterium]|nr:acylphosphatase [Patescibacteria group bacterium]